MGGMLHFRGDLLPPVGTLVVIRVDSVNSPTGIWKGQLLEVGNSVYSPRGKEVDFQVSCRAMILDLGGEHNGCIPAENYQVYSGEAATDFFMRELAQRKEETRSLEKRLVIEREVFHGVMKALTSRESFTELKKLLDDFLSRFTNRR
ncbi:MAG: hypothetical protein UT32_C0039G0001 [Parcubacteria group bacterium GW2011_GWC2_39_14]|nr:MAG: hypothetical protein UT32_C0039G0001 [Parcubacteria group bacterium GW2011_GWC2_39_14]